MKIDVHNHAIPQEALQLLGDAPEYRVEVTNGRWCGGNHVEFELLPSFVDPEAKLAELERNEIDGAIVSSAPPLFYYELNAEPAATMARTVNVGLEGFHKHAPARLWWMASVPMQEPDLAVEILEEAAARPSCVGVEIGSSVAGIQLDDARFEPFWAAAERLSLPVLIHPDPTYTDLAPLKPFYLANVIGMPLETTIAITRLIAAGVLERHGDLRIVLVHAGGYFPYQAGRLKHARTVREELSDSPVDPWSFVDQLWFDVIAHDGGALEYLFSRVGAERVLLGTDLPFDMALPNPVGKVREALGPDGLQQVAEANPAGLFELARATPATEEDT